MSSFPGWQLESITLEGRHVRLEPLEAHHADALAAVALDPRIWEFSNSLMRSAADVQSYVTTALEHRRLGAAVPFVTVERQSATAIGCTRFESIDMPNRRVEIGWTWLGVRPRRVQDMGRQPSLAGCYPSPWRHGGRGSPPAHDAPRRFASRCGVL